MAGSASRITLPPSPPSPPSGPPRGTYFSRRKLMHPAPPSPPLTKTSISSTNMSWSRRSGGAGSAQADCCCAMLMYLSSPLRSNRTYPLALAKSVWSTPRPTLAPGLKRVPRCRTRMLPAVTNCPPKRFTPSIWGLESRPFLELPTPFLWAMVLDLDLGDADSGHGLPMPAVPPVVLSPLELHDQDLAALPLRHHLPYDLGGGQRLRLHRHLPLVVHEEDLGELDGRPLVLPQALDLDDLPRGDPVLLAPCRDDRFHACDLSCGGSGARVRSRPLSRECYRQSPFPAIAASAYLTTAPELKSSRTGL